LISNPKKFTSNKRSQKKILPRIDQKNEYLLKLVNCYTTPGIKDKIAERKFIEFRGIDMGGVKIYKEDDISYDKKMAFKIFHINYLHFFIFI